MIKNILKYFPLLLLTILISCGENSEKTTTFFGGKIINPKTKFVVLYTMDKLIDTLFLDDNNKFFGTYNSINEGLYYFEHGNENQYIYLEPKDSLMLRLNTWDFDESLVFAGKGAERNNILIDIFLESENENMLFYQLNKLEPNSFKIKIDSVINNKLNTYKDYVEKHPKETSNYFKVLKVSLTYPMYARVERYPISHYFYSNSESMIKVNDNFYDFRKNILYNNDSLMYYTPYVNYIRNYLYNSTYALGHKPQKNDYSSEFTVDLLNTIDKNINLISSKNAFLKSTVLDHFYKKSSCKINKETFNLFFDLSTNKEDKELVKNLLNDSNEIHKGNKIINFNITDFTNYTINIHDFIKSKNTVLHFWSSAYTSKPFLGARIYYLQNKYPELNFAIIEIDGDNNNRIPKIDIKNQFYINSEDLAKNFLTSNMPRTILVNKNGIVENGFASLTSKKIYSQLKDLSNK